MLDDKLNLRQISSIQHRRYTLKPGSCKTVKWGGRIYNKFTFIFHINKNKNVMRRSNVEGG